MAVLRRCEIWSDYQCAGGTPIAHVPTDHCESLVSRDRVTHDDVTEIRLPKLTHAYDVLEVGHVWRFLMTDGAFEEWRVWKVRDSARQSQMAALTLQTPLYELGVGDGCSVLQESANGVVRVTLDWAAQPPATIVASILAFCPAWWSAGTITPTIAVSLKPDGWLPLRGFRELVKAIVAQGVDAELDFRPNGTSGYFIDIISAIGASAPTLDVRSAKNLLDTDRTRDRERTALEVVPLGRVVDGQRATMGPNWIECTAKASATLTVQQPVTGGAIIAFANQFDGLYLVDDAGARQLISNCNAGTQQLDVASGTNFTAGRWYRLVLNSSGDACIRVRKTEATPGPVRTVTSEVLDSTTNLLANPAQRAWAGAASDPPDGWVKETASQTLTRTTTAGLWVFGGQSCRVQTAANVQAVRTALATLYVPTWATHVTWSAWLYVATQPGTAQFDLQFRRDGTAQNTVDLKAGATLGTWQRWDFTQSLTGLTGAVRTFDVRTVCGVSADYYFDSAQVAFSTTAVSFTEGSNPTRLLALANRYLVQFASVPAAYEATYGDLHAWDPAGFPYDEVKLGQLARVRDTDLGITVTARLLERERNWKSPLSSRLVIAHRPDDLITRLTGSTSL